MFHYKYVTCDIFVWVHLYYSYAIYPHMLPKRNNKLLTLLFRQIISINPQNYKFVYLFHTSDFGNILHIITGRVLQGIH